MYGVTGLGAELAPDDPILSGEGSAAGVGLQYPTTGSVSLVDYLSNWAGHIGVTSATPEEQAAAREQLAAMGGAPAGGPAGWLSQNKNAVYLVAGGLLLMAMFGGGRRA